MINGSDYFVHYVRFPNKANPAMVFVNDDGTFDVYLNTLYDNEYLASCLEHELKHLENDHFYVDMPVSRMERQAEGENINLISHPPAGYIIHFKSLDSFGAYIKTLAQQNGFDLNTFKRGNAL